MRKIYCGLLTVVCLFVFCVACDGSSAASQAEYLAFQTEKNARWGLIALDGTVLCADEFKNAPSPVFGGMFTVPDGQGVELYRVDKKVELIGSFVSVGTFYEAVAPAVKTDSRIVLIDKKGNVQQELMPYSNKEIMALSSFVEGLAVAQIGVKAGYVDTKGVVVIEPLYDYAEPFDGGVARVAMMESDEDKSAQAIRISYINKKGEKVFDVPGTPTAEYYVDGHFYVIKEDKTVVYDKKGERITSYDYPVLATTNSTYLKYEKDKEQGILDRNGEVIVRAKYKNVEIINDSFYIGWGGDRKCHLYTIKGEKMGESYLGIVSVGSSKTLLAAEDTHDIVFIDFQGKPIDNKSYYAVEQAVADKSLVVFSEYFSAPDAAAAFVAKLTADGVDRFGCGQTVAQVNQLFASNEAKTYSKKNVYVYWLESDTRLPVRSQVTVRFDKEIASPIVERVGSGWFSYRRTTGTKWNDAAVVVAMEVEFAFPKNEKSRSVALFTALEAELKQQPTTYTQESVPSYSEDKRFAAFKNNQTGRLVLVALEGSVLRVSLTANGDVRHL